MTAGQGRVTNRRLDMRLRENRGRMGSRRVQFGEGHFVMVAELGPLTIDTLAAMLHDQTVGCYEDDRCLEAEHRFKPSGTIHTFDAASLLPVLQPYLHRIPEGREAQKEPG